MSYLAIKVYGYSGAIRIVGTHDSNPDELIRVLNEDLRNESPAADTIGYIIPVSAVVHRDKISCLHCGGTGRSSNNTVACYHCNGTGKAPRVTP